MPIKRSLTKLTRLPYHASNGLLADGPPNIFPNVNLPYTYGDDYNFKLPKAIKRYRVYIGYIYSFHNTHMIQCEDGHYRLVRPTSGNVGFGIWLSDQLLYCVAEERNKYLWYGWNSDKKKIELQLTHNSLGQFASSWKGHIGYKYIESCIADPAQEAYYWQHEHLRAWPDWLHKLEAKAYRKLYKAAEAKFGIQMPWGIYKGAYL